MRIINFIKPLPPEREKELRIWYRLTFSMILGVILLCSIITGIQLYIWFDLYRTKKRTIDELAPFSSAVAQQKNDRNQQELFTGQTQRLERYVKDPKNPLQLMSAIITAIKELQLQAISISSKSIEIQITAPSPEAVLNCMERLGSATQDEPLFSDIQLAALSSAGQQIQATIKAVPVRGLRNGKYDRRAKS